MNPQRELQRIDSERPENGDPLAKALERLGLREPPKEPSRAELKQRLVEAIVQGSSATERKR